MNGDIEDYIEKLVARHPRIKSIWLFGSRANNSHREESDWDLLIFADQEILDALKESQELNDKRIDLLVVFNGNDFEKPWSDEKGIKKGTLNNWEWKELSSNEATYKSVKYKGDEWFKEDMIDIKTQKAVRLWPKKNERLGR